MSNDDDRIAAFLRMPAPSNPDFGIIRRTLESCRDQDASQLRTTAQLVPAMAAATGMILASNKRDGEERIAAILENGGEVMAKKQRFKETSIVVDGQNFRMQTTTDSQGKLNLLELYIRVPDHSQDRVTYYTAERHGDSMELVRADPDAPGFASSGIACSHRRVQMDELIQRSPAKPSGGSTLYNQMARATGNAKLRLICASLIQPSDPMYELPDNSCFAYEFYYGVDLYNISKGNPIHNSVPISSMHSEISKAYSIIQTYTKSSDETNAALLNSLFPATHHKLRFPDNMYSLLLMGLSMDIEITFQDVTAQSNGALFNLINTQFKQEKRSSKYKCMYVHGVKINNSRDAIVVCIDHFAAPSSRDDHLMFKVSSFFNIVFKQGFFYFEDGSFQIVGSNSSSAKYSIQTINLDQVPLKDIRSKIESMFFSGTGKKTYSWKTTEQQLETLKENNVSASTAIIQDAMALQIHTFLVNKPYTLVGVRELKVINMTVDATSLVDMSFLKNLFLSVDPDLSSEEYLDLETCPSIEDLLRGFFRQLDSSLSDEAFHFGTVTSSVMYIMINANPSMCFEEFIDFFFQFLYRNFDEKCKFESPDEDIGTQKYSMAYLAVCFFSTLFVTCDVLCNCKEDNQLGDVYICGMLPQEYRAENFCDLGPRIHSYAWELFVKSNCIQESRLRGSKVPVYKNITVGLFIKYFATCHAEHISVSISGCTDSHIIEYARKYVLEISDQTKEYLQLGQSRSDNVYTTPFSQSLRNFPLSVATVTDGSMNIFEFDKAT